MYLCNQKISPICHFNHESINNDLKLLQVV